MKKMIQFVIGVALGALAVAMVMAQYIRKQFGRIG
jgi:heme/copper-type cytochrome/quinol oxidase subunit 4